VPREWRKVQISITLAQAVRRRLAPRPPIRYRSGRTRSSIQKNLFIIEEDFHAVQ